jgi:hypothetical protein
MGLTGQQQEQLAEALFTAFPTQIELSMMLDFKLGVSVQRFASPNDDLLAVIFKLIRWAQSQGRLEELIIKARERNPGNPQLNAFVESFKQAREKEKRTPKLGPVVPLSCNRIKQEMDFNDFFLANSAKTFPQIYFIHGNSDEAHGSLVKRFYQTTIRRHANKTYGADRNALSIKNVQWPDTGNPEFREKLLYNRLFQKWDPEYQYSRKPYTPAEFRKIIATTQSRVLVIQHDIDATLLDGTTFDLIRSYVSFWEQVQVEDELQVELPEIFIFLNVFYPISAPDDNWLILSQLKWPYDFILRKGIQRRLDRICREFSPSHSASGCVGIVLEELPRVRHKHVNRWFKEFEIGEDDDEYRKQETIKIFTNKSGKILKRRSMSKIEPQLREIVKKLEPDLEKV